MLFMLQVPVLHNFKNKHVIEKYKVVNDLYLHKTKRRGFKSLLIKSTIIQRTYRYENYNDFKMQYFTQSCLMKHFV